MGRRHLGHVVVVRRLSRQGNLEDMVHLIGKRMFMVEYTREILGFDEAIRNGRMFYHSE